MMRRWVVSIFALALLAAATTAPAVAVDLACGARTGADLDDYVEDLAELLEKRIIPSQIEEAERLRTAAENQRDQLVRDNGGTEPDMFDEAVGIERVIEYWDVLDEIDRHEKRIGKLEGQLDRAGRELEVCRREQGEAEGAPSTPYWERVAVYISPRNTAGDGQLVTDPHPTEVREAKCTATEERITVEWKNVDPRDEEVLSELQFAYTFQKPPAFFKRGDAAVPLEIEATVTGEHIEGTIAPWTTGGYSGSLRTIDVTPTGKPPMIGLGLLQIPEEPLDGSYEFSIVHGPQVGTYFLSAYVILGAHPMERCEVVWEYQHVP